MMEEIWKHQLIIRSFIPIIYSGFIHPKSWFGLGISEPSTNHGVLRAPTSAQALCK